MLTLKSLGRQERVKKETRSKSLILPTAALALPALASVLNQTTRTTTTTTTSITSLTSLASITSITSLTSIKRANPQPHAPSAVPNFAKGGLGLARPGVCLKGNS